MWLRPSLLIIALLIVNLPPTTTADEPTFVTWETLEPDKCASIWLIKRFIAPAAQILFIAPDTAPPPGAIVFDTPDAPLRRSHNRSTYETLLAHYRLTDARLIQIGRIMHDIEINLWARKALPETRAIEAALNTQLSGVEPQAAVGLCLHYFEALYASAAK